MIHWLALATLAAIPVELEFHDVEAVDGHPIVRFRPVELGPSPVRPLKWEGTPPRDVRYGLATVGVTLESALAVAWEPDSRALWVDADGDGRLVANERHDLETGKTLAVASTILVADRRTTDPAPGHLVRTLLFRPGLLGEGPRFSVRGAMSGTLALGSRHVRVWLTDGNANGGFNDNKADRAWLDLDDDGRFDPVAEQFPLGTPIPFGGTVYTIASDPWARSVSAHERDTRQGRLRLSLRGDGQKVAIDHLTVDLVSATGEFVTISAIEEEQPLPVGRYRIAGFALEMGDAKGRVWSYTFNGGRRHVIPIEPTGTTEARLLDGLDFDVSVFAPDGARPGDDVDVTPMLRLASGLYLANCTWKARAGSAEQPRTAAIALVSPLGVPLDRASSGFS